MTPSVRFSVDQRRLNTILASMQNICSRRTTVDATTAILFQVGPQELVLKSTDLEMSLQYSCQLESSNASQSESFLVSGKRVFELVRELDDIIECVLEGGQITLVSGSSQLSLNVRDVQEFPPFPERIENLIHFKAAHLLGMLERVAFVVPQNNANPALNGLLLEIGPVGLKMTATDGHCLAQLTSETYKLDQSSTWLLPRRAIFELKRLIENGDEQPLFLGMCNNQIVFSGESFNLFCKLLVDSFPHCDHILASEGFADYAVSKNELVKSLRRAACLLSGQFIATSCLFDRDRLVVSMTNKEVGRMIDTLTLSAHADDTNEVKFYAPYILNGLQELPGDAATFKLKGRTNPIIFHAHDDVGRMVYLVMPVSPAQAQP